MSIFFICIIASNARLAEVLECRSAIEPEARNAHHSKLEGQHVPFPRRKVSGARRTAPTDESGKVLA
jgi:hypothetical protein